jgi:hypothetical protein
LAINLFFLPLVTMVNSSPHIVYPKSALWFTMNSLLPYMVVGITVFSPRSTCTAEKWWRSIQNFGAPPHWYKWKGCVFHRGCVIKAGVEAPTYSWTAAVCCFFWQLYMPSHNITWKHGLHVLSVVINVLTMISYRS